MRAPAWLRSLRDMNDGLRVRRPDYSIFVLVVLLSLFGLVMVFSASYYTYALKEKVTGVYVIVKQGRMLVMGLAAMLITMQVPYHFYSRWRFLNMPFISLVAVGVSALFLIIVLFTGADTNGAKRWLEIGPLSFQPSEVARFAMILFVGNEFARKREDLVQRKDFVRFAAAFAPSLLAAGILCGLILAGRNLSMTAATGLTFLCMCIAAGINWRFMGVMGLVALGMGVLFTLTESYRVKRLLVFMDPFEDAMGNGYQVVQSLYALGNGGLTGVGLGNSTQKYLYLTYGDSDFIYAIIGEETGFIGICVLLAVYALLIIRGLHTAWYAADTEGLMLSVGVISAIAIQLLINVAVCTSSMPPTGVPLPFISSGGSSMVIFMGEAGILLNVSRYTRAR